MYKKNYSLGLFKSSGRVYCEDMEYDFLEDKFRIINSKAFRRLEYKTQVFINYIGDHYRTRLTHSLEVGQIAVYIAKQLRANEELAEVIALSHDLGHPPFGHAGERALNEVSLKFGGFDHNVQVVRIVTQLEKQFPKFNGLNLTLEALDGILKHNGPINQESKYYNQLKDILDGIPIKLSGNAFLEAQIASLADDIAYSKHDIDDGVRAGFVKMRDFCQIEMFKNVYDKVYSEYKDVEKEVFKIEVLREFGKFLVENLLHQTKSNLKSLDITEAKQVVDANEVIVSFSDPVKIQLIELKKFLFDKVYRNFPINRVNYKACKIIQDLFTYFMNYPVNLPQDWQQKTDLKNEANLATIITDYIAGMTDRFAVDEHRRVFDLHDY
ncbi:dGTP triphosphohydrolase [Candidatus Bandiella euplotis]|uniref:Deoxyguanosinetriphosphate triphosphohydrolase-like protein n=1 Tax=Candidatus Bandiella euplotis TaxID=1664265 RepID=A0ABZ0UL96_9RICK|nr:dNTP triphosphohydrolase [Candidatus Bandiella woodruffii]WPX96909.1 Deoxyguanosinetriphosphate triphosphohydrolase [Candidatus Bandiella woodruffii]